MDDVAKYKLEVFFNDDEYQRCRIGGLKEIYFDNSNRANHLFSGAACLIKNKDYKGYCNLCIVYHSNGCDEFENGFTIQFAPLYNSYGQIILLEYDRDEFLVSVESGRYRNYDISEIKDSTITFFKNGFFTEFYKK